MSDLIWIESDAVRPPKARRRLARGLARWGLPPAICLCGFCLLLFGWRLWDGLSFPAFTDEATHVLGAKMVSAGGVLYRSFVDSHGPFVFMVVQIYGRLFGWAAPNGARVITALLALLAVASVACSPGLRGAPARLAAVTVLTGVLAAVWLPQALFMLNFYPMAGALAGVGLAGFVVGAWRGATLPLGLAFAAGMALALMVGAAYSFAPTALLFAASGGWAAWQSGQRRAVAWFLLGAAAGGLIMLAWLLRFGDLVGYLAFHVAQSQAVYARYIGFSWAVFLRSLVPSLAPDQRIQSLALICTAASLTVFIALALARPHGRGRAVMAIALGFAGILLLNARGMAAFQNGSFVVAAVVIAALAAGSAVSHLPRPLAVVGTGCVALLVFGAAMASRAALFTPFGVDRTAMARMVRWPIASPAGTPFFLHLRSLVRPDERILALVYQPNVYLAADRLPMEGFYAYFPWDAEYARAPWFGRPRDLCAALLAAPPPVIVFDNYPVWGYQPSVYMPCLFAVLARTYVRDPSVPDIFGDLYVRSDRMPHTP